MLQIANLEEYTEQDIPLLVEKIRPILRKRQELHNKYTRYADASKVLYSDTLTKTQLPFEKFLTDLATGYSSGKPAYTVDISLDEEKNKALEELLDVKGKDESYQRNMKIIIDYITNYNDDEQENHDLFHDIYELTSCYELIYENEDNEIVYSKFSPLQTVATWDYNIPANLTGLVRVWDETSLMGTTITKVELTDKNGSRIYNVDNQSVTLEDVNNHNWGDVPAIAVETDYSIFEPCEDVIQATEQLIQNIRNTYQYNDQDCKLKIVGYRPNNEAIIKNDKGDYIPNPARAVEDNAILNSKTFYIESDGDVSYITKPLDSSGAETILKLYQNLMFQLAGIPNTTDLAFNSADLNASAIDRKFYIMNMCSEITVAALKKAYLRRWELIFNHINIKKSTNFDFRDIKIELPKNLPSNDSEQADYLLKLRELISDETIAETLGFNYQAELSKRNEESMDAIQKNLESMQMLGISSEEQDIENEQPRNYQQTMEEDRANA